MERNIPRAAIHVGTDKKSFIAAVKEQFPARFGHDPKFYDVVISDGARKVE